MIGGAQHALYSRRLWQWEILLAMWYNQRYFQYRLAVVRPTTIGVY
jgi:hypothetical protein